MREVARLPTPKKPNSLPWPPHQPTSSAGRRAAAYRWPGGRSRCESTLPQAGPYSCPGGGGARAAPTARAGGRACWQVLVRVRHRSHAGQDSMRTLVRRGCEPEEMLCRAWADPTWACRWVHPRRAYGALPLPSSSSAHSYMPTARLERHAMNVQRALSLERRATLFLCAGQVRRFTVGDTGTSQTRRGAGRRLESGVDTCRTLRRRRRGERRWPCRLPREAPAPAHPSPLQFILWVRSPKPHGAYDHAFQAAITASNLLYLALAWRAAPATFRRHRLWLMPLLRITSMALPSQRSATVGGW